MNLSVSIEGLDVLQRVLDPEAFRDVMDEALEAAAGLIRDEAKRLPPVSAKTTGYDAKGIPVDSGRLRQSIQKRRLSMLAAEVYAPTNYSIYVHEGTGRMPARPFFQWTVEDFGGKAKAEDAVKRIVESYFKAG